MGCWRRGRRRRVTAICWCGCALLRWSRSLGAGIVSAALPRSIAQVVVGLVPEVTLVILPEGESNSVAARAAEAIGERLGRSAAMVVGPGLGTDAATAALLGTLFGFTRTRGAIGFGTGASGPDTSLLEGTIAPLASRSSSMPTHSTGWRSKKNGGNACRTDNSFSRRIPER